MKRSKRFDNLVEHFIQILEGKCDFSEGFVKADVSAAFLEALFCVGCDRGELFMKRRMARAKSAEAKKAKPLNLRAMGIVPPGEETAAN